MEVKIRVDGDPDGLALASLQRWLAQDTDVTRETTVRIEATTCSSGDMGGMLDTITAMVNNGIALGSLIVAYQAWRDSRPQRCRVILERGDIRIDLSDTSPEMVNDLVKALSQPEEQ
jgi:hypothetical protein